MVSVLVFPSVLGVLPGIRDTVDVLEAAGHDVSVVDVLDGRTFDDYEPAMVHHRSLDQGDVQERARQALAEIRGPLATVGFSAGCVLAEWSAAQRPDDAVGVVLVGGALPMEWVEATWPAGVPAQTHAGTDDPFDDGPEVAARFRSDVEGTGGSVEAFTYEGAGHLFNEPTLSEEFDERATVAFYDRLAGFLSR